MENKTNKKSKLNFYKTLVLYAIVPMLTVVVTILSVIFVTTTKETIKQTKKLTTSISTSIGQSFDYSIDENEVVLKNFATSPIVVDFLKDPSNEELAKKAQQYTLDYYGNLNGWEGIYIADWNSKVLTHPAPPVIGKVMREGEKLKELQDKMNESDGVYNVGIITSPASGELIISMYAPVYDENKNPIGYVGAGTFVNEIASKISDVSNCDFSSIYTYYLDRNGNILYHPDVEKIGQPVENDTINELIEKIQNGEELGNGEIEYKQDEVSKIASYYVGMNENYIEFVTVDKKEVTKQTMAILVTCVMISLVAIVLFVVIALIVARPIAIPLKKISIFTKNLADGDLTASLDATSHIEETILIMESVNTMKSNLNDIVSNINSKMNQLDKDMENVDNSLSSCLNAVGGVSTSIDEISKGAVDMAESVTNTSNNMSNIGNEITSIQSFVKNAKANSEEVIEISKVTEENLEKLMKANENSILSSKEVTAGISSTDEAVKEISVAAQMITEIASQTNLLSLNASIEAARAGEAGRGFAVVADEIGKLAQQSNESAIKIKEIVSNITQKSNENIALVKKIHTSIENEGTALETLKNSFKEVNEKVHDTANTVVHIFNETNDLAVGKENVIDEISTLSSVTEENAASCQETTAIIEEINATMESISSTSKDTVLLSKELKERIAYFKQ